MFMEKRKSILKFFLSNGDNQFFTANTISKNTNMSVRSVKTYIGQINSEAKKEIIVSSRKGYHIPEDKVECAKSMMNAVLLPQNYETRKKILIQKLLFSRSSISILEISEQFAISDATLRNEISKINAELANRNLYIKSKNNHLFIVGKEKDSKKYALELINKELETNNFDIQNTQKHFRLADLNFIRKVVTATLAKYEYFIDDYALLNYVIHLALCIEFNNSAIETNSYDYQNIFSRVSCVPTHILKIISEIYEILKKTYHFTISSDQFFDASTLMITRVIPKKIETSQPDDIASIAGTDVYNLIQEIGLELRNRFDIDISNDAALVRFALHLKNLLSRLNNNVKLPYHQFSSIKNDYPYIYVIAIYVSLIISKYTNKKVDETEISYITLHLGMLISENKAYSEKVTCILVVMDYYTVSSMIMKKIKKYCDDIIILDIISSIKELKKNINVDMILTNYYISNFNSNIPLLKVSTLIDDEDLSNIRNLVNQLKLKKNYAGITKAISNYFDERLFYYNPETHDKNSILELMCNDLKNLGYVNDNFKKEIYAHEEIASSSYQNIAIPHTFSNDAKKSTISVAIFNNPILWDHNKVYFIFMISLTKEDNYKLKDIFRLLFEIISNKNTMKKLMKCTTYSNFTNLLTSYYKR